MALKDCVWVLGVDDRSPFSFTVYAGQGSSCVRISDSFPQDNTAHATLQGIRSNAAHFATENEVRESLPLHLTHLASRWVTATRH